MAHYCLDLSELLATDRVVPVVIFLRGQAPQRDLVLGSERYTYLRFSFIACELAVILVARLNLPNMHYVQGRKLDA